jgi:peptide/nickel transport system substrate-binding protein
MTRQQGPGANNAGVLQREERTTEMSQTSRGTNRPARARHGGGWTRRAVGASVAVAASLLLSACGGSGTATKAGTGSGADRTLRTALSFDPGSLDPDLFYGNEGLMLTTACYDGLLAYKDNTTEIEPALAESYKVSNGAKRYTFKLRPNVKFADGTPFDAEAMRYSIERRRKVDGGPAYMVAPITHTSAPDPQTLVIDLKTPINPFPHWLASPYGLKAVNPTLVKQNEKGNDVGKHWLATHCAGTGPYDMTNVKAGQHYELKANANYWGTKPEFRRVVFSMIPSFSTQALQLRSGDLDMMTHGLTTADVTRFESDPKFAVSRLPGISAINLWINPHKPNLRDVEVRKAIGLALDRKKLDSEVYGEGAEVYNGVFAPGTLPPEHDYDLPYDPAQAKATMNAVPADKRTVTLQFTSDDATNQQIAGIIAQQLNAAGFKVNQRGLPETEVFNFTDAPENKRPDMIVLPQNPDDASPSSFPQLQWLSGEDGGFFPPFDPEADKVFFKAVQSADDDEAMKLYGQAADMYRKTYAFVPIANTKAVIVNRKGIGGVAVERQGLWTVDLAALTSSPTASGQQK